MQMRPWPLVGMNLPGLAFEVGRYTEKKKSRQFLGCSKGVNLATVEFCYPHWACTGGLGTRWAYSVGFRARGGTGKVIGSQMQAHMLGLGRLQKAYPRE